MSSRGSLVVRFSKTHSRYSWGVCDQAVIAVTNFVTAVLLARALGPSAFGAFTLVYTVLVSSNTFFGTLVTRPHNVLAATLAGEEYRRYTASTALQGLGLTSAETLLALAAAAGAFVAGWGAAPLLLALAPAMIAWQVQEMARRILYTEDRLLGAFLNDLISYAGQAVAVAALWRIHELTGPTALYALAATSALGAALGCWQVHRSLGRYFSGTVLRQNWSFGRWLAGAEFVDIFSSTRLYIYLAAVMLGTAAAGVLRAIEIFFGPMRVLGYFFDTVLPIRFKRLLASGGDPALALLMQQCYLLLAPLLGLYCVFVAIFAKPILHLVYGGLYTSQVTLLMIWTMIPFLGHLSHIVRAALTAKERTRAIFVAQIYTSAMSVILCWFMLHFLGIDGAALGLVLNQLLLQALFFRAYFMSRAGSGERVLNNAWTPAQPAQAPQVISEFMAAIPRYLDTERAWLIGILATFLAVAVSALSIVSPMIALGACGVAALFGMLTLGRRLRTLFLGALSVLLVGYAFFNKGFAYLGKSPIYVGEAVLVLGILALLYCGFRAHLNLVTWLLFAFMALGLARTVPYIPRYGVDAFRDSVDWSYALFAIVIASLVRPVHFRSILSLYRKLIPVFLIWVPIAAAVAQLKAASLPKVPGSDVPILVFKGGDVGVQLAGVGAFVLVGLYASHADRSAGRRTLPETMLWPVWFVSLAVAGAINRGGFVACAMGLAVVLILRPSKRWLRLACLMLVFIGMIGLINPIVNVGNQRTVSIGQIRRDLLSITSNAGGAQLQGTKDWRLKWWGKIVGYTVHGPYFWNGKGFGINLATADGFQLEVNDALRSPHNSHLTILARMGVPGFVLWILLQGAFGASLVRAFFRARRTGRLLWLQVDCWLLAYWLAALTDMSFDPYLEGPQGGIWFWAIFGLGLAALAAQRTLASEEASEPAEAAPDVPQLVSLGLLRQAEPVGSGPP